MKLYILKFKDIEIIKIGISWSPEDRISSMGASEKIDWDNSYLVNSLNERNIRRLEKQLHGDFENFRMDSDKEYLKSGNTEIFKSECLTNVLAEIEHKIKCHPSLQLSLRKGITNPASIHKCSNQDTACQEYNSKPSGRHFRPCRRNKFHGVRELIQNMIKYKDDSRVICYDLNNPYGDFDVELDGKPLPPESLYWEFVGIHNSKHPIARSNYTNITELSNGYIIYHLSGHICVDSREHEKSEYCRFRKLLLKQAEKLGLPIINSSELSSNEKLSSRIEKQVTEMRESLKIYEHAEQLVSRELRENKSRA